jgi:hypothetical protein
MKQYLSQFIEASKLLLIIIFDTQLIKLKIELSIQYSTVNNRFETNYSKNYKQTKKANNYIKYKTQ